MKFSIIIPAHNEAFHIIPALKRLRQISPAGSVEIIVADGGSDDGTAAQAQKWADHVLSQERPNRGEQLHRGAQKASGNYLFFLCAGSQLPCGWRMSLERFWLAPRHDNASAAVFRADFGSSLAGRIAARLCNASARWRGRAFLEQGLCVPAETYRRSGGFPPLERLEDFALCGRLRPLGRIFLLPDTMRASAGALQRQGLLGALARRLCRELVFHEPSHQQPAA